MKKSCDSALFLCQLFKLTAKSAGAYTCYIHIVGTRNDWMHSSSTCVSYTSSTCHVANQKQCKTAQYLDVMLLLCGKLGLETCNLIGRTTFDVTYCLRENELWKGKLKIAWLQYYWTTSGAQNIEYCGVWLFGSIALRETRDELDTTHARRHSRHPKREPTSSKRQPLEIIACCSCSRLQLKKSRSQTYCTNSVRYIPETPLRVPTSTTSVSLRYGIIMQRSIHKAIIPNYIVLYDQK